MPAGDPAYAAPAAGQPSDLAVLIDAAVQAIGYVWLCCGAVVLVGAAVALVWLMQRGKATGGS